MLFLITLFGAGLRLLGLFDDFWLDEVWSFGVASHYSPLKIITNPFYSNSHILNVLFICLTGKGNPAYWFKFRLLSLIAGILTIPATYLVAARISPSRYWRLVTVTLIAVSFPLIYFSCEARGYALVVLFGLLSFYFLSEFLLKNNALPLFVFYCSFILGFLSHLSFIYVSVGLLSMSIYFLYGQQRPFKEKLSVLLRIFAFPAALIISMYLKFILSFMHSKGVHDFAISLPETIKETAAYLFGFSYGNSFAYLLALIFYIILIKETLDLLKECSLFGVFCASSFVGICLDLLLRRPEYFYLRYLLAFFPFFIIMFSHFLYRAADQYRNLRLLVAILILLVAYGNLANYSNFLRGGGRGHYSQAVDYMRRHSRATPVTVETSFGNCLVVDFYSLLRKDTEVICAPPPDKRRFYAPEWIIKYSRDKDPAPLESLNICGVTYVLEKVYPRYSNIAGSNWMLYHGSLTH